MELTRRERRGAGEERDLGLALSIRRKIGRFKEERQRQPSALGRPEISRSSPLSLCSKLLFLVQPFKQPIPYQSQVISSLHSTPFQLSMKSNSPSLFSSLLCFPPLISLWYPLRLKLQFYQLSTISFQFNIILEFLLSSMSNFSIFTTLVAQIVGTLTFPLPCFKCPLPEDVLLWWFPNSHGLLDPWLLLTCDFCDAKISDYYAYFSCVLSSDAVRLWMRLKRKRIQY